MENDHISTQEHGKWHTDMDLGRSRQIKNLSYAVNSTIMGDMRKDYISERFTIISKKTASDNTEDNPYKPGNESMTKPSVLSLISRDGVLQRLRDIEEDYVEGWSVRVFESDYPVVSTEAGDRYSERPHYMEPAYGYHYVVVTSSSNAESLATISRDAWSTMLVVVQDRTRWLYTQKHITYVAVHASYGNTLGGGDNPIPHMHIIALSTVPPVIREEIASTEKMHKENGACPICQIAKVEKNGPRMIIRIGGFIAFCPWSPRYPYEFWIVPEKHTTSFTKLTQKHLDNLATIIRVTLGGLTKAIGDAAYNIVFHLSPETKTTKQIHWHIEIYPMTEAWSGLEHGYGIYVNSKSPEDVAGELGSLCRREFAIMADVVQT